MLCGTKIKLNKKKWKPSERCNRTDLLTLHRPTRVSKLKDSVPRPSYRPVKDALPVWKEKDLCDKIPMHHGQGPNGPLVLHRGLVGKNPLRTDVKLDFLLTDPNCHEISYDYNPLHDPHLKGWANLPVNRKHLYKQGLITKDRDVICTVKEYNEYRRFLCRVHNNFTDWKRKKVEADRLEQRKIEEAKIMHEKDLQRKLKYLEYLRAEEKPKYVPKKIKKPKPKCRPKSVYRSPSIVIKPIETFTLYGKRKNSVTDPRKYQGTFIKGSPEDFYLSGLFDHLFQSTNEKKNMRIIDVNKNNSK